MNLKEVLGEKYRDDLTLAEIEEMLLEVNTSEELMSKLAQTNARVKELEKDISKRKNESNEKKTELEQLKAEFISLQKQFDHQEKKQSFISLGYDETLANRAASAYLENNFAEILEVQKIVFENINNKVYQEKLKNTPIIPDTTSNVGMTREALDKMSLFDRLEFSKKYPEEYKKIYEVNVNVQ